MRPYYLSGSCPQGQLRAWNGKCYPTNVWCDYPFMFPQPSCARITQCRPQAYQFKCNNPGDYTCQGEICMGPVPNPPPNYCQNPEQVPCLPGPYMCQTMAEKAKCSKAEYYSCKLPTDGYPHCIKRAIPPKISLKNQTLS